MGPCVTEQTYNSTDNSRFVNRETLKARVIRRPTKSVDTSTSPEL